ncbi:MAG: ornithine cyclodeaminase family protein [Burkholderiales bacterium]|nr:ornithine cyclodeaminase family protein [Burkholderiales bacterium]
MQIFDARAVRDRCPLPALVQALRRALVAGAEVPQRHVHALPGGASLLLMPAWRHAGPAEAGRTGPRLGVKTVTVCPGNSALGLPGVHGLYSLFDARTGVPLAVLDGGELTARRTVAASALAASYLAREDATKLLVVGAGRVAALLPEAMRAVRPGLAEFTVWARRAEAADAVAAEWRAQALHAGATRTIRAISDLGDLAAAVHDAHIVSCATLATEPLVRGAWLQPGTHLDLIGSFTPAMREADGECFVRSRVWVDTSEALAKAGDLLQAVAEGAFSPQRLQGTLADLARADAAARTSAGECTLFKSVGTAVEDLAAAELVFEGPG